MYNENENNDSENEKKNTDYKIEFNEYFKVPIYYNEHKISLKENIITDLELVNSIDSSSNPIYSYLFDNSNTFSKKCVEQITQYYTTDVDFLKDNQTLLKEYIPLDVKYTDHCKNYKNIIDIWNELKIDNGFKERYYYVEWEKLDFLNRSELFLQFMSMYNLLSPVFSLFVPIIILIIPFVVSLYIK